MDERTIFLTAVDKTDPGERSAWLDEACGSDVELRRRVEALLRAHEDAGSFLEHPPEGLEPPGTIPEDGEPFPSDRREGDPTHLQASCDVDLSLDFLGPAGTPDGLGTLGPYEITEVIGRGGMGVVLKGRDPKLNRVVAIKVLAPELAANATARRRFLREAQAAAAVSHDHVVTIHAVDEHEGLPYLVMEYVSGQSLQERLDQSGPLEVREILRIGRQIAAGLAAAHEQGLIHRDVKPANILLENGVQRVKLTDFGLARAVDDAGMTQTGIVAGTPQYMSPEQAQGESVDHCSDLFSLGCVLYAMCTGRSPFRGDSAIAAIRRVCDEEPRPIPRINPDIPERLVTMIDGLLAKNPRDRSQSAHEVAERLGQQLAELQQPSLLAKAASISPASPRRGEGSGARGRRWMTAAAALLVLCSGLGLTEATGVTRVMPTVIRIVTGEGTLIIEVDDPGISVQVDGEDLVIKGAGVHEVRMTPGKHRIEAIKDGQPIQQELVTITRGGKQVVKIELQASGGTRQSRTSLTAPRVFQPSADEPITQDGVSVDQSDSEAMAWKITAEESRTVRLFEVEVDNLENCVLAYRAKLKAEDLDGKAYLEMWVRAPGRGQFFSKDLAHAVSGTTGWASYETPFFLKKGEQIDLVKLNLVIQGRGTVWIKDVQLLKTPSADPRGKEAAGVSESVSEPNAVEKAVLKKDALKAAREWIELIDAGKYAESWTELASGAQAVVTQEQFERALRRSRKPLGQVTSRKVKSRTYTTTLPGVPDGHYIVIQFATEFEDKEQAVETVPMRLTESGQWRASGYFVK